MTFDETLSQVLETTPARRDGYRIGRSSAFDLDEEYLEDLKAEIIQAKKLAVDEDGAVLVWTGGSATTPARVSQRLSYTPYLQKTSSPPGRRAQAGDGPLCRHQGLDRVDRRPRPGGGPSAARPGPAQHDGGGTPLRGHGQPGAGRWHHGPLWGADRPRRSRRAGLLCGLAMQAAMRRYTEEVRQRPWPRDADSGGPQLGGSGGAGHRQ